MEKSQFSIQNQASKRNIIRGYFTVEKDRLQHRLRMFFVEEIIMVPCTDVITLPETKIAMEYPHV